jgi:hypothetical protein
MNEAEFIARRIIRTGAAWAEKEYEENKDKSGVKLYYTNQFSARIQLLNFLADQFLSEEKNAND